MIDAVVVAVKHKDRLVLFDVGSVHIFTMPRLSDIERTARCTAFKHFGHTSSLVASISETGLQVFVMPLLHFSVLDA